MADAWETIYRWQWFQRAQWAPTFREWKRHSPAAFAEILASRGGRTALDCSCGLGLKTIVMKEAGLDACGSDGCSYAVERARELAAAGGLQIDYFVSRWEDLPERTDRRFDAVFNDALSWTVTRDGFEASLRGFHGVLAEGGVLAFFGAEEGPPSDDESRRRVFEGFWAAEPQFEVEWSHESDGLRCTALKFREKGDMFVDSHHIFLVDDGGALRLETATVREPCYWHWDVLEEMFCEAGFSTLETLTFERAGAGGRAFTMNLATK